MKQKKPLLQANNMEACFSWLLRSLKETSKSQLPKEREKFFKSFAESTKVDSEFFNCHAVSLAVVCHEPITSNGKQLRLASLELHAMNCDTNIDMSIPLIIDHKKEVGEYLNQDETVIVEKLINTFKELNQSFATTL